MPARHRFRALAALAPIVTAYAVATGPASAVDVVAVGSVEASEVAPAAPSGGADRYLVRLARGSDVRAEAREMREQGVRVRRTFTHAVDAAAVSATPAEIAALAEDPQVLAIEPDVAVHASATQDGATWGLDRVDQRSLPLSGAFSYPSDAAGVDVYVVDTGVLAGHDELRGRVATGFTAVDDGRGASDCNGHGTHVAGTAAGTGVGVAKAARVVPVRVLGCDGSGTTSQVIAGLDWIVAHHSAGSPAVVNLSLGGPAHAILDRAVERVVADGVTVVVAAGNDAADACLSSPARVPAALTVAATTRQDGQASFSNHGGCVDLYAPGVEIVSAHHSSATAYARMSGTSMAAPHVAGAAAVHLALQSSLTPAEVASRIVTDATPGAVSGATPGTPNRLLFLVQSIAPQPAPEPATAPAPEPVPESNPAPSPAPAPDQTRPGRAKRVTAKAVRRAVKVTWVRPLSVDLTRQVVRVYVGSRQVTALRVPAAAASVRVERLAPGRAYRFTVVGVNRAGRGPESRPSTRVVPGR